MISMSGAISNKVCKQHVSKKEEEEVSKEKNLKILLLLQLKPYQVTENTIDNILWIKRDDEDVGFMSTMPKKTTSASCLKSGLLSQIAKSDNEKIIIKNADINLKKGNFEIKLEKNSYVKVAIGMGLTCNIPHTVVWSTKLVSAHNNNNNNSNDIEYWAAPHNTDISSFLIDFWSKKITFLENNNNNNNNNNNSGGGENDASSFISYDLEIYSDSICNGQTQFGDCKFYFAKTVPLFFQNKGF